MLTLTPKIRRRFADPEDSLELPDELRDIFNGWARSRHYDPAAHGPE